MKSQFFAPETYHSPCLLSVSATIYNSKNLFFFFFAPDLPHPTHQHVWSTPPSKIHTASASLAQPPGPSKVCQPEPLPLLQEGDVSQTSCPGALPASPTTPPLAPCAPAAPTVPRLSLQLLHSFPYLLPRHRGQRKFPAVPVHYTCGVHHQPRGSGYPDGCAYSPPPTTRRQPRRQTPCTSCSLLCPSSRPRVGTGKMYPQYILSFALVLYFEFKIMKM